MFYYPILACLLSLSPPVLARYTPAPRWAQAASLVHNTLYVHGGLSDPFNSYSYSSAPEISDLLVLDLSTSFDASSPPWQSFPRSSSPALGWHTLSAFSNTGLLLFGGQPGPNSLTVITTANDSSGLLSISDSSGPSFLMEPQNWANEPMRRMRHSASLASGKVWIIGGEQADGSGNAFSEHYSFGPSGPEFVQLPLSDSAPPDVYGHVSLVLPDERLLVLGGYCASCSGLVPMNMMWSLDTTQDPPVWERLSTASDSLPAPRRDFAAVVLADGQILVHGGGDAQLQTTYSDGWILDTRQDPMVWKSVAALAQLGERKDHLAVQAGGYVFFCFGYGSSSPASASLFIYDPTTSSMVTSYDSPSPDSVPAMTSLPAPAQTRSNPNASGGASTPSSTGSSSDPLKPSGSSSGSSNRAVAIALSTVFGVLGLVAGGVAVVYYMKRVHNRGNRVVGRFSPLANDPELSSEDESVGGAAAAEATRLHDQAHHRVTRVGGPGVIRDILAYLGIDTFNPGPARPRKDMFADEDARSSGWAGHSGTAQRQHGDGASVRSLRSLSALVRGVIGRESRESGLDQGDREWEKAGQPREGVEKGSIRQGSQHSSHVARQRDGSLWSYTDPFEDPGTDDLDPRVGTAEKDADYDCSIRVSDDTSTALDPQDFERPFSVRSRMLTPLREASHASLSDAFSSLPSLQEPSHGEVTSGHDKNPALSPPASTSPTLYSPTLARLSDTHVAASVAPASPASGSSLTRSRSDSWWSRLTKSPLVDRRASMTSPKALDFRDPTPAPRLEGSDGTVESSEVIDVPTEHGRSLSSAHSGRTANTDAAERLGGNYDVVQRLSSDGSGSRRVASQGSAEITEGGMYAVNMQARSEISLSSSPPHVDPPQSTLPRGEAPTEPQGLPKASPRGGGAVTSGVRRRRSRESEPRQTSPLGNTRGHEEVSSRTRLTVEYGVAPRASLFIANPDLGQVS